MKKFIKNLQADLPASLVVFLVALPLCLGIALASKAPLFSGIITGAVGGIIVGMLSGSPLSVSGPAAGLTAIVATAITDLGQFDVFLLSVVLAGLFQLILGFIKAGVIGDYIPNAVIKGMLAAIGVILILKQMPHLVGYDADFEGDEQFLQSNSENTFSELPRLLSMFTPGAVVVGILSLCILVAFESAYFKKNPTLRQIPGALIAVISGVVLNYIFSTNDSVLTIQSTHLVSLPILKSNESYLSLFQLPDFTQIWNPVVWKVALTLAIVASLETLLSIEAVDKLDPYKRVTPTDRELKAQGIGNITAGLLGGLPLTSVIVRSSANVNAGGRSKISAITHGIILFSCALLIPTFLNQIPLASLAAILIFTGYKLAKWSLFKEFYQKGLNQFIPFTGTILAILFTDLLIGICIGMCISLFYLIKSNFQSTCSIFVDGKNVILKLKKDVSFLNKPLVKQQLESITPDSYLLIDISKADFIDRDIIDVIFEYMQHASLKNIKVELKKNENQLQSYFTF